MMLLGRVLLGVLLVLPLASDGDCRKPKSARDTPNAPAVASAAPVPTPKPDLFVASVRPILLSHCAPCHEPGGKLYERLPFDDAGVVASHSAGVLKRINAPAEKAAIEEWLKTMPEKPKS
jgi:hypothetical protein